MANVGNLVATMELRAGQFVSETKRINNRLSRFERNAQRTARAVSTSFRVISAAIAGVGFSRLVSESLKASDQIAKLNDRLGISTEAISELGFVAERSGVKFNTLSLGLQRLQRRVAEAAQGTGEARGALQELGIDAQKLVRLSLDQQFEIIADSLAGLELDADRTRLAMKLFDSEGVALVQTMKEGAAGVQELRRRARELGASINSDIAGNAAAAQDAITDLRTAFDGLVRDLANFVAPALTKVASFLANDMPTAVNVYAAAVRAVAVGVSSLFADALEKVAEGLRFLQRAAEAIPRVLGGVATGIGAVAQNLENQATGLRLYSKLALEAGKASFNLAIGIKEAGDAARENLPDVGLNGGTTIAPVEVLAKRRFDQASFDELISEPLGDPKNFRPLSRGIEDAIRGGADAGAEGLKRSILQTVQRELVGQIASSIARAIGGRFDGGGGVFGFLGGLFGGARAMGGPVSPGRSYLVGERGPELFTPNTSGQIAANGAMGGLNYAPVYNVEAGVDQAQLVNILRANDSRMKAELVDLFTRPGRVRGR